LDDAFPIKNKEEFFKSIGGEPNCPAIALLPGSRISEIDRLVKPMIEAWQLLRRSRPGLQAVIPLAPGLSLSKFKELLPADRTDLFLVDGRAREVLVNCDFSVVASGTATVEAALSQTPFVVVYRLSRISYLISRLLVRGVSFFAMPNLIAGKRVVTELLQSEVTGERIAEEIENLFGDPGSRERQKQGLQKIKEKLATKNSAGKQAALLASKLIEEIDEKKLSRRWSRS
jgi:lipid-A-disaccharide synthase